MIYAKCVTLSERNLNDNISCDQTTFNSNEMTFNTILGSYNVNDEKKERMLLMKRSDLLAIAINVTTKLELAQNDLHLENSAQLIYKNSLKWRS